jgi:photosystem II stability/assembly factor-like uncharacterized protein
MQPLRIHFSLQSLFGLSLLFIAIVVSISLILPVSAQELIFRDDFDDPDLPGWEVSDGVTVRDGILTIEPGGQAIKEGVFGEAHLTVRLRRIGLGAVAVHYIAGDEGTYFVHMGDEGVGMILDEQGQITDLEHAAVFVPQGEWAELEITWNEELHQVSLNGEFLMEIRPPRPIPAGAIVLRAEGDSIGEFDYLLLLGDTESPEPDQPDHEEDVPSSSELSWVRLGGPPGGLGYDIRYNFDNPDIWYVTDANAGVHISTDDGLTWHQSNTGIDTESGTSGDSIPIFCLTVDPHNPQIIWVGTDMSGRIYKSTDGGSTWEAKDQGVIHEHEILLSFRGFTVDPRSSDIVYAMGELQLPGNNVWGLGVGGVIYKTTNGGDSWVRIWNGEIPSSLTRYMWIDPRDPDILYVSTGIFDRGAVGEGDPDTDADPFGGLGVLKSTDGGATWRTLGKENGLDFLYIGSLFMHPEDPDVLLAAAGHIAHDLAIQQYEQDGRSPMGIYRTSDGGENWTQVLIPDEALGQAFSAVELCPSDPDIVYAGSDASVYRSEDGGLTWKKKSGGIAGWGPPGVRAGWPIDMQCDPEDPNRVFANNYSGGNFLSEDGGSTWVNASTGYSGAQIINLAVDPYNPARVFVGGRSGGWYSNDGGLTWNGIRNPGENTALAGGEVAGVAIDPSRPNHILIGTGEYILEWSGGEPVWQTRGYPMDYGPETSVIEFAPSNPDIVYAGSANHNTMVHTEAYESGHGVILSRDGGASWELITGEVFKNAMVTDLAIDPTDAHLVYVATRDGLFRSKDAGGSWQKINGLPPNASVRTVAVNPQDPQSLIAGVPAQGLFISRDAGESWYQVSAGLEPNGDHRDIVFDLAHSGVVYTSDIASGVYRSEDGGESWHKLSEGLTSRAATGLALSMDGNHLYAATSGGGVFRLDLNGKPPESTGITLFENQTQEIPLEEEEAAESVPEDQGITDDEPIQEEPSEQIEEEPEDERSIPCLGGALPLILVALISFSSITHQRKEKM